LELFSKYSKSSNISFVISKKSEIGDEIGKIRVTDSDKGAHGNISFSMISNYIGIKPDGRLILTKKSTRKNKYLGLVQYYKPDKIVIKLDASSGRLKDRV
jgi:hypothetical protein